MKPILKFPKIIILSVLVGVIVTASEEPSGQEEVGGAAAASVVQVPLAPDYVVVAEPEEYYDHVEGAWPPEEVLAQTRSARAMYLAQGVEFVFPIGVQYTLANLNEGVWPLGTEGFDGVLEFPKNKIAIMFSSMINTLKIANFSVTSKIYTPDEKLPTTALRILGTEFKPADFRAGYKDTWTGMNKDIAAATGGAISEFIPRGGLYGRTIYPFTTAAYVNSLHYENQWAFPWKDSASLDKFTDSTHVSYMEVEGLMPYYENDAFIAVAALFKSGTGSVVFLKPKGAVTILQLMLNPTALTQIFDESFPGWGVKQMRVHVPKASFTTNSQHFDMLVKRGVTNSFCVHEATTPGGETTTSRYSLNPIVQTNHIRIAKETFSIASVTGVTLNNEKDLNSWNTRQRDDMAPETLLEEYTTPKDDLHDDDPETSTVVSTEEVDESTTVPSSDDASSAEERSDLGSITLSSTEQSTTNSSSPEADKTVKKGESATPTVDFYDFNEPFLWFLHAINEEPMFMGVIESFKRYLEETGNKENVQSGEDTPKSAASGLIDKNRWIYEAAKGVLWHCPSLINKQAE